MYPYKIGDALRLRAPIFIQNRIGPPPPLISLLPELPQSVFNRVSKQYKCCFNKYLCLWTIPMVIGVHISKKKISLYSKDLKDFYFYFFWGLWRWFIGLKWTWEWGIWCRGGSFMLKAWGRGNQWGGVYAALLASGRYAFREGGYPLPEYAYRRCMGPEDSESDSDFPGGRRPHGWRGVPVVAPTFSPPASPSSDSYVSSGTPSDLQWFFFLVNGTAYIICTVYWYPKDFFLK